MKLYLTVHDSHTKNVHDLEGSATQLYSQVRSLLDGDRKSDRYTYLLALDPTRQDQQVFSYENLEEWHLEDERLIAESAGYYEY